MAKDDWLTMAEAAELTEYTAAYIRELINIGQVKAQKWGRSYGTTTRGAGWTFHGRLAV